MPPKIWLKIKLLDFEWQFSRSCFFLFTFPWDLETHTGPGCCSRRWTPKFVVFAIDSFFGERTGVIYIYICILYIQLTEQTPLTKSLLHFEAGGRVAMAAVMVIGPFRGFHSSKRIKKKKKR